VQLLTGRWTDHGHTVTLFLQKPDDLTDEVGVLVRADDHVVLLSVHESNVAYACVQARPLGRESTLC